MKYALVNGEPQEAFPTGKGLCRGCGGDVIAKCGTQRLHHWAHRGERDCDSWWEPETEWHRAWKNNFPAEYQESIRYDEQSGEKHIADVRTNQGLVIEFQHSHLKPEERAARERFYGNMLWVVDGTRLKNDYPRFLKSKDSLRWMNFVGDIGFFRLIFPEECFPSMWVESSVPVVFDFKGLEGDESSDDLWCLLPGRAEGSAVGVVMPRSTFIKTVLSNPQLLPYRECPTR